MSIAKQVNRGAMTLLDADERVYRALQPHKDHPLIKGISAIGGIGDQPQIRFIAGATILAALIARNRRLGRAGVRMLLAHEAATLLKGAVKARVDRTRPQKADRRRDRKLRAGNGKAKAVTSFPSGHSAGAMAAARAFSREYPELARPATAIAGVVAAAQVPKCSHYVTDVAAGLTVGVFAEALVNAVWNVATPRSPRARTTHL